MEESVRVTLDFMGKIQLADCLQTIDMTGFFQVLSFHSGQKEAAAFGRFL